MARATPGVKPALAGWTPVRLGWSGGEPFVEWARFVALDSAEPFFEQAVEAAMGEPFNLAFGMRTPLDALATARATSEDFRPAGLIFHMSHCGSTLISQMLRAVSRNIVIAESAAVDGVVWAHVRQPTLTFYDRARLLRNMVAAIARNRPGPSFLKLHALHALHLPVFASAFPGVPWTFAFRDPIEVLVAQARQTGGELLPGVHPPAELGLDPAAAFAMPRGECVARVLATVCNAALHHAETSGTGSFIDYASLPGAVLDVFLPALDIEYDARERGAMQRAAAFDAKSPRRLFHDDTAAKRAEATPAIVADARSFLERPYRAMLERAAPP
jgi:hypothetical protein